MNTIENNKLIAEFMGAKEYTGDLEGQFYGTTFPHGYDTTMNLKYNTSWDWLMPVIEKIENLGYCVCFESNEYLGTATEMDVSNFKKIYISEFSGHPINKDSFTNKGISYIQFGGKTNLSKIEAVYDTCIKFIQWYNQQSK